MMQPSNFNDIKIFIKSAIDRREVLEIPSHFKPSGYWKYFVENFAYVFELPDHELSRIRYHTYHLTGDLYFTYLIQASSFLERMCREYECLVRDLDGFEPEDGYGYEVGGKKVTVDLLRYMQVLADISGTAFAEKRNAPRMLEIGGGYGGLASVCMTYNPKITYIITDLEETMFFQAVNLANRFGFNSIELCNDGIPAGGVLTPGRFYLLPQTLSDSLVSTSVDIAINQQSLQEMSVEQIRHYCDLIRKVARFFYSFNSDQHSQQVAEKMKIVQSLQRLLDSQFPRIKWQSMPANFNKYRQRIERLKGYLGARCLGRPERGLAYPRVRRVIYECR